MTHQTAITETRTGQARRLRAAYRGTTLAREYRADCTCGWAYRGSDRTALRSECAKHKQAVKQA